MAVTSRDSTNQFRNHCISKSQTRSEFWVEFINSAKVQRMVEVGVYQGDFAAEVLHRCASIDRYYMLDPWRHLQDWNKPLNQDDESLERSLEATKAKTDFGANRRLILRGKTTEVIDRISDGELAFAYIDGDHTLRGIAIDLICVYPKLAVASPIYALPNYQFCLQKTDTPQFSFIDLTGQYNELSLRDQLALEELLKLSLRERLPSLMRIASKAKHAILD